MLLKLIEQITRAHALALAGRVAEVRSILTQIEAQNLGIDNVNFAVGALYYGTGEHALPLTRWSAFGSRHTKRCSFCGKSIASWETVALEPFTKRQ